MIDTAVKSGQIRKFTGNDYGSDLAAGNIAACVAWSGDVVQLQADNPAIKFVVPEAGGMLWSDNAMIPNKARHKANAERLLNFYYDPINAAKLAIEVNFVCPVAGAQEEVAKLDPALAKNELVFPTEAHHEAPARLQGARREDRARLQRQVPEGDRSLMANAGGSEQGDRGDLRLVDVTKRFGPMVAVDDLTLTVAAGSFFALLGPSGCGKTTTLRMVGGLEQPTDGRIHLGEVDITDRKPYQRPVNTVFQSYALFPHLDIFENVAFGLRRRGNKDVKAKVHEALAMVELAELARRKPGQLSGGQQQRVALARALVNRPQVLLLDEPLGALDLKLRRQMQLELKRIQTDVGLTFVHVTHDQEEAMTMADTIAVMNLGKVEQLGRADRAVRDAGDRVRGELPRPVQPAVGHGLRPLRR